ncbi:MAG TPA: RICIN domain-containing protein, partial [Burkholderiaceae bacterium]
RNSGALLMHTEFRRIRACAFSAAVLSLAACGGGGGGITAPTTPTAPMTPTTPTTPTTPVTPATPDPSCPVGAVLTAVTPDAGQARKGSVFSSTLYNPTLESGNTTHKPLKLQVKVTTASGDPVKGCNVAWKADGTANGWVFADATSTDPNGLSSAWWTAGSGNSQALTVSLARADGSVASTTITGSAQGHSTRANSIHIGWETPAWQAFTAEVTPHSFPATTYYEVIGFNGGYGGVQSHQLLFSLWDVDGISPEVIDPGMANCSNFGGEGTGIKCEVPYEPEVEKTYRFELQVAAAPGGKQDYTMYVTDPKDGQRKKIATMRLPKVVSQSGGTGFVEDWATEAASCLDNAVRSATFGRVRYQGADGNWVDVVKGKGSAVYTPDHNEVCANYSFKFVDGGSFLISTGGTAVGKPLNLPGIGAKVSLPDAPVVTTPTVLSGVNVIGSLGAVGSALDIPGGSTTPGTPMEIYPTHGGGAQQWTVAETAAGSGLYTLINPRGTLALAAGATAPAGTIVTIETPNGSTAQQWRLVEVRTGVFNIVHVASSLVLDTKDGAISALTPVVLAAAKSSPTQEWNFTPATP